MAVEVFQLQRNLLFQDEKLEREISNMKDFCMPETLKEMLSSLRGKLNGRLDICFHKIII